MRPFLLVGCGGSGGITLQYLMDQLSADLARFGVDRLPAAWQFVHVDVPTEPDGIGPGMPPVITHQSPPGTYVGLATPGSTYPTIAGAVSTKLAASQQLPQLATWWADPAREPVQVPVQIGAGQRRAVGRVVTLGALGKVREALEGGYTALKGAAVTAELERVAERVSPGTESQAGSSPVVIVVSSMAGGAGASMVLDVCRLVSAIPGHDAAQTALFLFTPEVFESLPPEARAGVPANALAMTGELVATQLGAATADDVAVFRALGLGSDSQEDGTFGRVFPVGSRIGDTGAKFGDDHKSVYRGLGRGLAGLLLSGQASRDWVSFDLGNAPPDAPHEHGGVAGDVLWGSFGFAQLSLGRDRYAEYAAQRLARGSVDRLVDGHLSAGGQGTGVEQLNRLVDSLYVQFLRDVGMPGPEGTQNWFRDAIGDLPRQRAAEITTSSVEPLLDPGGKVVASQWIDAVLVQVGRRGGQSDEQAQDAAYGWAHAWAQALVPQIEQVVAKTVALYGLPTANALLERLASDANGWVQDLREGGKTTQHSTVQLEPRFVADVRAIGGQITAAHGVVASLREAYARAAAAAVTGRALALLAEVMASARTDLVQPLRQACDEANRILRQAVGEKAVAAGLAQLKTDHFVAWPQGGQPVPSRFMHSQNEVLLIDSGTFQSQFDEHLLATTTRTGGASTSARDCLDLAVGQVVLNRWETTGPPPTDPVVVREVSWRSASLPTEPGRQSEVVQSRRGLYRLAVKPEEVLARSRQWVERPGTPFHAFVTTSLRSFVDDAPEFEQVNRGKLVEDAFRKALHLAQPLVAVSSPLVSALTQAEPQVTYKFSEVPFGQLALADDLVRAARQGSASATSVDALQRALRPVSQASRIDVFGSYRPMAPVVFSSLLAPLANSWAAAVLPADRAKFLRLRRSRRLAGAVAMSDQERLAFVGGWYVARLTGRLRLPGESHAQQSVQLWHERDDKWHSFPHPLLASDGDLRRNSNNYLPAVLTSYGLALAQVSARGTLQPLDVYRDVRHFWDDQPERGRETRIDLLRATVRLQHWVTSGDVPPGSPAPETTPVARRDTLRQRAAKARAEIGKRYLSPGQDGAEGGGQYSTVDRVQDLAEVPLFHEVAADVHAVYGTLLAIVETLSVDTDELVADEDEF